MLSRVCRTAAILVIASLFWIFSAANVHGSHPAALPVEDTSALDSADIVYSQPPNPAGGLFQSSLLEPGGSATDEWVWDDFTLGSTQTITEVQWRGAYIPAMLGSGGPVIGFTLKFYPSNLTGFEPDVNNPLVGYTLSNNAGETPADVLGGVQTYAYRYSLPAPFQAVAGTKYWIQIEAIQQGGVGGAPDWGLSAGLGGDGHHFRKFGNEGRYQTVTGDTAFTLAGPVVPIANLSATNDSPTAFGQVTTFTATVSAGSGINYTWDFGDQMTDSGRVVTHTYTVIGSYTVVVTATNLLGSLTAMTHVTITDAPIAGLIAINNSPTPLGHVTNLTATIASGSNVNYQWNFGNGALRHGKEVTYTYATIGFHSAIVTATNGVSVVTATTPITIFGATPLANAGRDQTVTAGAEVTLDGSGSFAAPGHWPLTYFWQQLDGMPVVLNSYTISQPVFIAPAAPTTLTFTLVVTDAMDLASEPDQVQINVMAKHYIYLPLIRR
jgi:PKD repeat protein